MLNTILYGTQNATNLLIAHGLFGSARNWRVLSKRLSEARPVLTVDMRNHGSSPWFQSQTYADMAADLAQIIEKNGGHADVLGHSMGGKAAMVLALSRPELVRNLIVADIAPVAYGHSQMPLVKAMQHLDLSAVTTRRTADEQLLNSVPDAGVRAFLLQSLDITSTPPKWQLNLDIIGRYMSDIIGFPDISGSFTGRVLFLAGGKSDYIRPQYLRRILEIFPNAEFKTIAGSGHWLHAEKPREFEAEIRSFLDEASASQGRIG